MKARLESHRLRDVGITTLYFILVTLSTFVLGEPANARVVAAAGGIDASSSDHALVATVGQHAIGYSSNGITDCGLGFWTGSAISNTCCTGTKGNVDNSPDDIPDISDLIYLVEYMVFGGPPPVCIEEADLMPDGIVDISDIVMMIVIMYIDHLDFPPCGESQNKTTQWTEGEFVVEDSAVDGRTSIVVQTERELLGIQLSLRSPDGAVEGRAVDDGMEAFVGYGDDSIIALIFDMEGVQSIAAGRQEVLVLDRECEIVSAVAINDDFQRMAAEIRRNSSGSAVPEGYTLFQNIPNPFNPTTEISFDLPHAGWVRLDIVNILGQTVATVFDDQLSAGHHSVMWDGSDVSSGVYFYRLSADGFVDTKKMLLLK